jgi:hypothetical protein
MVIFEHSLNKYLHNHLYFLIKFLFIVSAVAAIEPSNYHVLQLKSDIFEMLVHIKNEHDLEDIYDYLHSFRNNDMQLSPEQEAELGIAISETYDPKNLIPHEEAINMMKSW